MYALPHARFTVETLDIPAAGQLKKLDVDNGLALEDWRASGLGPCAAMYCERQVLGEFPHSEEVRVCARALRFLVLGNPVWYNRHVVLGLFFRRERSTLCMIASSKTTPTSLPTPCTCFIFLVSYCRHRVFFSHRCWPTRVMVVLIQQTTRNTSQWFTPKNVLSVRAVTRQETVAAIVDGEVYAKNLVRMNYSDSHSAVCREVGKARVHGRGCCASVCLV